MKSIKQSSRTRHQRNRIRSHKRSIFLICLVIFMLSSVIFIDAVSLSEKNKAYQQQEAELLASIDAEDKRTEEIEEFKTHVNTQLYTEEVAKDKLGLIYPNEIIFKPQK